ncbi:hypothetical protein SH1V18_40210 [Vallitalea longa]|uniref:Uncharacterized protein n=1 Tax=Vallitalea longa TaxID=2936439 RepID=A0A9W5YF24_9FIRM|nr:hypothetical protein [Vallitalea longa]GKX31541.1 hypothetical protein SH1V18_40210 [Vallitalea longa]
MPISVDDSRMKKPIPLQKNDMAYKLQKHYNQKLEQISFDRMKFDSAEFSRYAIVQCKIDKSLSKGEPLTDVAYEEFYTYGKLNKERNFMSNIGYDMSFMREDVTKGYYDRNTYDLLSKGIETVMEEGLWKDSEVLKTILQLPTDSVYRNIFESEDFKNYRQNIINRQNDGKKITKAESMIKILGDDHKISHETLAKIKSNTLTNATNVDIESTLKIDYYTSEST